MINDDEMIFEMFEKGPDGDEWMTFDMTYNRKK
jgi:hypothetical protein